MPRTLHYRTPNGEAACGRPAFHNVTPDLRYVECQDCRRYLNLPAQPFWPTTRLNARAGFAVVLARPNGAAVTYTNRTQAQRAADRIIAAGGGATVFQPSLGPVFYILMGERR